ncbi:MAG: diguanylate cyclase [Ruminococcaceae bacterium]|jgi:nitroreductase|nr:diguanylate cyclase [Oscillospiraceae bacterium]
MKKEAIEVLMNRRSVRKFKPEQITDEQLKTVLDAGTYAPTAKGEQRPYIVAVQDKATRDAVAALNAKVIGMSNDTYYGAPTIILVLAPADEFGPLDAAAVETNMLNAAYACGLGSCWIHRANAMFKTEEGKALLRQWGLDESLDGWCSIALGYADMDAPAPKPRKEGYYRIIK